MTDLKALAIKYIELRDKLEKAKAETTLIQKEFDILRQGTIPEAMDAMGLSSVNIPGVGRMTLTADMFTGILPDQQLAAHKWLIDNGHEDIIREYVHPSTLKAFLKEQFQSGVTLPDEIFRITPYQRATVTKL
jgi:hypothetical protein